MQTATQPINYAHEIAAIVRRLPPERGSQVLAFARFIAYETFKSEETPLRENEEIWVDEFTEDDAQWEATLASEAGQDLLDKLADEALADIRAGKAKPMVFTNEGEIAPE